MSLPTLPRGLRIATQGYAYDGPGGVRRTALAGGAPRYGLEYDRGIQAFQCTMVLPANKLNVWTLFYHHVIRKGSLPFELRIDSGMGITGHECNMVPDSYSVTRTGSITVVTFAVEAEASAYGFTTEEAETILQIWENGDDPARLFNRLAIFANKDTLVLQ